MGIHVKDQAPFIDLGQLTDHQMISTTLYMEKKDVIPNLETKGNTIGFSKKFLEDKALALTKVEKWYAFKATLALLIYGILLFPNIDDFIDIIAIDIFLSNNLVPTLLVDVYYYLHFRHEKKGVMILCCAPLLYNRFLPYFPKKDISSRTWEISDGLRV